MSKAVQVWMLLSTVWGSTWLVIRVGVNTIPPFTFAWLRFVMAIIPLLFIAWLRGRKVPRKLSDWNIIALTGMLFFTLNYALVYWGEIHVNSGLGAILYTTMPLFSLIVAHFFIPGEKITPLKLGGVIVGLVGVCIIFLDQLYIKGDQAVFGVLAIVGAALCSAFSGMLVKTRAKHLDAITLTAGQMVVGLLGLSFLAITFEGNPLSHNWTMVPVLGAAYLGILGTSLCFVLLNWLIHNMDYSKTQLIPFASTLMAVCLGWLLLDERIHWRILAGMGCVLTGLAMSSNLLGRLKSRMKGKIQTAE